MKWPPLRNKLGKMLYSLTLLWAKRYSGEILNICALAYLLYTEALHQIWCIRLNGSLQCCISCNHLIILLSVKQFQICLKVCTAQARQWGCWGQWKTRSSPAHISKYFLEKWHGNFLPDSRQRCLTGPSALVNQSMNQSNRTLCMD